MTASHPAASPTAGLDDRLPCDWQSVEEFLASPPDDLSPLWRTLLTSDGSTTNFLRGLRGRPITLDVAAQQTAPLAPAMAAAFGKWLDAPAGNVLQRSVWLTDGRARLVLGHSLLAVDHLDPALHRRLLTDTQPIGLLAGELGLPSLRDRLQIGRLDDPALARQFGTTARVAAPLWCRRYRLTIPHTLLAMIFEVFSPALIDH